MKTILMLDTRPISPTENHTKGEVYTISDDLADYYIRNGIARFEEYQQTGFDVVRSASTGEITAAKSGSETLGDPVTATRDDSGNVVGLSPSGISLPPKILINYHNGQTGLVVAAGAAEALFGPAVQIPAGLITPGCQLRMTALIQQVAASSAGARRLRIRSAATEAGLLAGNQAMAYESTSTTNRTYNLDKYGLIATDTAGSSMAIGVAAPVATTGASMLSLVFADLGADSWMQFSIENASDQALTIYHAVLYLLPAA